MFTIRLRNFSLRSLLDEYAFDDLKREFLSKDIRRNPNSDDSDIDLKEDVIIALYESIIVKKDDDFDFQYDEVEMQFYGDYLFPAIDGLQKGYKEHFAKLIEEKSIYETTALQNFSASKLKALKNLKIKFRNTRHLNEEVKERLYKVIENVYSYISKSYYQENFYIPNKIPFKLSKVQLVLLFQLLHNNKLIGGHTDDLSRMIDQYFKYYDKANDTFQDIEGTQRLARKIKNYEISTEKALAELKTLLRSDDFFNLI